MGEIPLEANAPGQLTEQAPGAGVETAVWFDLDTHGLVQGEISVDGARVILCRFTQFTMEPATQQEG